MSQVDPQARSARLSDAQLLPGLPLTGATPSEYETINGLLRVLRRRWGQCVSVTVVILLLGALALWYITPRYSSTTTLEVIKDDSTEVSAPKIPGLDGGDALKTELETDKDILESGSIAMAVIHDLNLVDKRPFSSASDSKEKGLPLDRAPRTRENLLALFKRNLKVEVLPDSRLLSVSFENPDPQLAAAISNSVATEFIRATLDLQHRSTAQASFWLRGELEELRRQVEDSEQKLADYQRKTGLAGIEVSGTNNGSGGANANVAQRNTVVERLFALNQELTAAEASRISAENIYRLVETQDPEVVLGLGAMSVPGVGANGGGVQSDSLILLRSLRTQESDLQREYSSYSVKYGANNPRLVQLQQQIEALQTQIKAELQRMSLRAKNAYEYALKNETDIHKQFIVQQTAADQMADSTVRLQILAQEAYSNRSLYEGLFSKLQTANLSSGVGATRIEIVESAVVPGRPSSPVYARIMAAILGLAIFLGVASGFLLESMDETVRTIRDFDLIRQFSTLAYLPSLPGSRGGNGMRSESQLITEPTSPFSEALRSLRTSVLIESQPLLPKTILFTSALGGDGKTTVVYNLGIAIAMQGFSVLLVDCDLRSPSLHHLFGCSVSPGVGDLRERGAEVEVNCIVAHSKIKGLSLLPAGMRRFLPAEFFGSDQFDTVLKTQGRKFDFVLVDSPPLLPVTDSQVLATKVTSLVLIIRAGKTPRSMISRLIQSVRGLNAPVMGFVLNDVRQPALHGFEEYGYYRNERDSPNADI